MCNMSEYVERRGIEKGRAVGMAEGMSKGRAEGMAEGMTKGMTEGIFNSIRSLMDSTGWDAHQAITALKIPEGERQAYLDRLTH